MLQSIDLIYYLKRQLEIEYYKKFDYCSFSKTFSFSEDNIKTFDMIILYCSEGPAFVYTEKGSLLYKINKPNSQFYDDISHCYLSDSNIYESVELAETSKT